MIPVIMNISGTVVANGGESVALRCSGIGEAPVSVSWVTPSGQIHPSNNEGGPDRLIPDFFWSAQDFVIYNVNASDGGTYTCTVENEVGSASATVVVYVTPYFTTEPQDILTSNGSIENAICKAKAFPPPDMWWVALNGNCTELESVFAKGSGSGEPLMYEHLTDGDSLLFDPVLFGDEVGVYCCVAYNDHGQNFTSISITGDHYL